MNVRLCLLTLIVAIAVTSARAQETTTPGPLQPGAQAPDFTATTLEGVPIRLDQWQGKVIVLNFFITWYRDAADHLQMMETLQDAYAQAGMRLLSVSLDEGERGSEQVAALVREQQIAHPVVLDPELSVAQLYGVRALPAIFIIGRDGKIAYYQEGFTEGDEQRLSSAIAMTLGVECLTPAASETGAEPAAEAEQEAPEEPICHCFRQKE